MKAALIHQAGPPEVLRYEDAPEPAFGVHDVLVRVQSVSVEGGDPLNRGRPLAHLPFPRIVGYAAAGEIIGVGAEVSGLAIGQRVSTFDFAGSHADLRAVSSRHAYPVPPGMDIDDAAATPIAFGTAHLALLEAGRLQRGEAVLVQAGASGVGMAAIQIAKQAGARLVIVTASSQAKLAPLRALGADVLVNYHDEDVVEAAMKATGGLGVDVAIDGVGGGVLQSSLNATTRQGRIIIIGTAAALERQKSILDVTQMGQRMLTGVFLGPRLQSAETHHMINDYMRSVASGEMKVLRDRVFPLSEAAAAHAHIENRQAIGRVFLRPDLSIQYASR